MAGSDFTKSVARVSEGFCPLCDEKLDVVECLTRESLDPQIVMTWCPPCGVEWRLDRLEDGRPFLRTSRALSKDEIAKLYDRESEVGDD